MVDPNMILSDPTVIGAAIVGAAIVGVAIAFIMRKRPRRSEWGDRRPVNRYRDPYQNDRSEYRPDSRTSRGRPPQRMEYKEQYPKYIVNQIERFDSVQPVQPVEREAQPSYQAEDVPQQVYYQPTEQPAYVPQEPQEAVYMKEVNEEPRPYKKPYQKKEPKSYEPKRYKRYYKAREFSE